MDYLFILVAAALAAVISRVYMNARKRQRDQTGNWDAKAVARIRAQGADPFKPYNVNFFFAAPDAATVEQLREHLQKDGYTVDSRQVDSDPHYPFSVHAQKSMQLSAPDMTARSAQLGALAKQTNSRYDGWTAA